MANSPQARKRARQAEARRQHQMPQRAKMRTLVKKVRAAIASQDKTAASEAFKPAVSYMDSLVNKGLMHGNTVARLKSRLNKHIKAMA